MHQDEDQQFLQGVLRQLIDQQQPAHFHSAERREQERVLFVQPVQVETDDRRTFQLLSRDLSCTGIRLIGAQSFLGQKVRLTVPRAGSQEPARFLIRVLWTRAVGDGLFENGAMFLKLMPRAEANGAS